MNRIDVAMDYYVQDGIIRSPGKFEGEAIYVPYFWNAYLNGGADDEDDDVLIFRVTEEDRQEFPELNEAIEVRLCVTSQGFVTEV